MHPFEAYLREQHLEALVLAVAAQVRYLTVYNATKGLPIAQEHAQKLWQAALHITRVPYTWEMALTQPEPIEQMPTLPIQKVTGRHR